jgi:hypothetical protein
MMLQIVSGAAILFTAFMSIRHGIAGLRMNAEAVKMLNGIGFTDRLVFPFSILTIIAGVAVLIPQTFLLGCVLNAVLILVIMGFALWTRQFTTALIEIPFLVIPVMMIYMGYPITW